MKRFRFMAMVVIAILLLGVTVWWKISFPSGTWRYKMTVMVETPEGIKTGSAVREVSVQAVPRISPHMLPTVKLKGEAVAVDLGKRGVLFALLSGYKKGDDYGADIPAIIFSPTQAVMEDSTIRYMSRHKAGSVEVPVEWYPKFVYFKDLKDPKTVEYLLGIKICSDKGSSKKTYCVNEERLEEAFGHGVKLKSVTIEMTEGDVTWIIDKYLPWLDRVKMSYLSGRHIDGPTLFERLHGGNFKQGR